MDAVATEASVRENSIVRNLMAAVKFSVNGLLEKMEMLRDGGVCCSRCACDWRLNLVHGTPDPHRGS